MKGSVIILLVFILGILIGMLKIIPGTQYLNDITLYILFVMMFLVGVSLGFDKNIWIQIKNTNIKILMVPLSTIIGTAGGILLYQFFFSFPKGNELYAIGAGFGYYSYSSGYISKISGEMIGIIALLANIIREVLTLVLAPFLVRYFGKLAPIAAGGATTSDTTLPFILKYSGNEYFLCAIINGVLLTLLIPVIIPLIYNL